MPAIEGVLLILARGRAAHLLAPGVAVLALAAVHSPAVAPGDASSAQVQARASPWRLLMSDDFDGTRLDKRLWQPYGPRWPGHAGNGIRDARALSVRSLLGVRKKTVSKV